MGSFDDYIGHGSGGPGETQIMVAMSGGVDSSVAAALLVRRGYRVIGATLKLWCLAQDDRGSGSCCSAQSLDDARSVCRILDIPHYVIDLSSEFERKVVKPFCMEYLAGRTPNPCVTCNTEIKFGDFLARAKAMGADFIATGHHVRQGADPETGVFWVKRGLDSAKDQSYALWGLTQTVLRHTAFPIGWMTKDEVRETARALGLPVADKGESQDVCFIPDGNLAELFEKTVPRLSGYPWADTGDGGPVRASELAGEGQTRAVTGAAHTQGSVHQMGAKGLARPQEADPNAGSAQRQGLDVSGPIKNLDGDTLGYHNGYFKYTVGQRRGLGVATGRPQYVIRVDPLEKVVYLGGDEDLKARTAYASGFNFICGRRPGQGKLTAAAKIRYLHPAAPGVMQVIREDAVRFTFDEPQRAITAGQSLVAYDGDSLIGGGIIERAER